MEDSKWERWLRAVTREGSVRGIARATGRSHTTVQRWITKGVPPQTVWDLTLRFRGDPLQTLIVMGRITPEQVPHLNFSAIVRYAPGDVLTGELHRRELDRRTQGPDRADVLTRSSFRLTSK